MSHYGIVNLVLSELVFFSKTETLLYLLLKLGQAMFFLIRLFKVMMEPGNRVCLLPPSTIYLLEPSNKEFLNIILGVVLDNEKGSNRISRSNKSFHIERM